jgi:hypothetical protein
MSAAEKIYKKYIQSLSSEERGRLLELLKADLEDGDRKITELEGLGASIWTAVDVEEYVDQLRSEWERE